MRNLAVLLCVVTLLPSACIPIPFPPTTVASSTPVHTATSSVSTETATHPAIPTDTASSTSTELPTATDTETGTPTFTLSPTPTETDTPTLAPSPTLTATNTISPTASPQSIKVPGLNHWQMGGLAFSHGAEGEWDHILWGGFANSLVKKGDTYYLYYQGSTSYDNQCESVSQRSIGVATSTDGVNWVKSDRNPVISWSSLGSIEEGAVSSAAWIGEDGRIYVYYGANTGSGCTVNANARLAVSDDGVGFQDIGEVLSGTDPNVWGSGDEIFPIGIYSFQNRWYLYYTPNGVPLSRKLGVAIGDSPTTFTHTTGLNDSTIPAWGPVSIILGGSDSVLITNPQDGTGPINFYRFSADNPSVVQLHDSYTVPNCTQASVIYESSTAHWMMSCRDQNAESYLIAHAFTP